MALSVNVGIIFNIWNPGSIKTAERLFVWLVLVFVVFFK